MYKGVHTTPKIFIFLKNDILIYMENTIPAKILIIEDESSVIKPLADKLIEEGFRVIKAENGEEGLRMALTERPDLILLDIVMTQMDGMTMMKKLRAENPYGKTVPIILLTNLNDTEEINQGIAKDKPAFYLIKAESSLNSIVEKVRECLNHPAQ